MRYFQSSATLLGVLSLGAAGVPGAARGDVTIEQQTQFDFAIVRMHGTDTEYTTSDKQRKDSDFHCEGMLSLLCGNAQSGEIVRLDRDLTWSLEPKKREYRETPFMTAAQRQAIQQEAQAALEKFKQCPAVQQNPRSAPDTSKCQMSPVKMDVKQTGTHQMFAGHDAQLTQIALTQSCTNRDTGEVCDFVYSLDSWLSQDQIPGIEDRQSFEQAYLRKLGLDDQNAALQKQVRQFLAPYSDMLKQLSGKAADLKGYPLKTAIRVSFGGEHCAAAAGKAGAQNTAGGGNVVADAGQAAGGAAASSAAGAAGSGAGTAAANAAGNSAAGSVLGSAASAFSSKLVSGLFAKKKSDTASPAAAQTSAAG
ncbi:MAG: hypothetical protein JO361_01190, partial [Gammaproteobacteria bacterium]|nr:hypothetical protein [Gammaproteobacteria bacterium]